MFCTKCGFQQPDDARYCSQCGHDLSRIAATVDGDASQNEVMLRVSRALKGQYTLVSELGRGGMGIVFQAVEKALDREVALKILPLDLSRDSEFVDRFHREAKLAARLRHPHIMPIFSVGQSGDVHYITMDLLRGGSLFDHMQRGVHISRAVHVVKQVASALQVAHAQNLVHRDIKPENILFDNRGSAVVTDFGIAKALEGTKYTRTGIVMGTFHYMSPEQIGGDVIDGRSDLYSLGVMFYEMVTGRVPFDGPSGPTIMYKHVHELPVPPPEVNPEVPAPISAIVMRLLEKDPAARFQTGRDIIFALDQATQSASTRSAPQKQAQPSVAAQASVPRLEQPAVAAEEPESADEQPELGADVPADEAAPKPTAPPIPSQPTPPSVPVRKPSGATARPRKRRAWLWWVTIPAACLVLAILGWWLVQWQEINRHHDELREAFHHALADENVVEARQWIDALRVADADVNWENYLLGDLENTLAPKIDTLLRQYDEAMHFGNYQEATDIQAILEKYGVSVANESKYGTPPPIKETFGKDNPFDMKGGK